MKKRRKLSDARLTKLNRVLSRDDDGDIECPGKRVVLTESGRGELTDTTDERTRAEAAESEER